jgi:hypothetical protein
MEKKVKKGENASKINWIEHLIQWGQRATLLKEICTS